MQLEIFFFGRKEYHWRLPDQVPSCYNPVDHLLACLLLSIDVNFPPLQSQRAFSFLIAPFTIQWNQSVY